MCENVCAAARCLDDAMAGGGTYGAPCPYSSILLAASSAQHHSCPGGMTLRVILDFLRITKAGLRVGAGGWYRTHGRSGALRSVHTDVGGARSFPPCSLWPQERILVATGRATYSTFVLAPLLTTEALFTRTGSNLTGAVGPLSSVICVGTLTNAGDRESCPIARLIPPESAHFPCVPLSAMDPLRLLTLLRHYWAGPIPAPRQGTAARHWPDGFICSGELHVLRQNSSHADRPIRVDAFLQSTIS
jgi:hypothetical protein